MKWTIVIGLLIIVVVIGFLIKTYNELVTRRNKVKNSWAHIDAQLQRRFDLIPNLVEIVRGVAIHERQIFESMANVVDRYAQSNTNAEKLAVNESLTSNLKSLYGIAAHYPELKSNANFLQLQSALTEIEEDISYARQFYNDAVTIYNNQLMSFPSNMIAKNFHFQEEDLFDAAKEAENAPKIQIQYTTKTQCPICGAAVVANEVNCKYCGCSLL
jgi:LemA protein